MRSLYLHGSWGYAIGCVQSAPLPWGFCLEREGLSTGGWRQLNSYGVNVGFDGASGL
jgi:hypothetical protein